MTKPRVIVYPPTKDTTIKGLSMVAKVNLIIQHNRINGIKVVRCPSRGLLVWPPAGVDLSKECKALVVDTVAERCRVPRNG